MSRRLKGKEVVETLDWANGLPYDMVVAIMQNVGTMDLLESIQRVCASWYKICKDPALWRFIDTHKAGDLCELGDNFTKLCEKMNSLDHDQVVLDFTKRTMNAVDRSCGQLISINLEYFGTNPLLVYIANQKHQLKSLRLLMCDDMDDEGIIEAVKKMPSLEELHIYFGNITNEGLEQVGLSCPGLKSLTYNQQWCLDEDDILYPEDIEYGGKLNLVAYVISRTMPELRNLSLFGGTMTNRGLKGILDGCPHLESLDIRQCFNVDLIEDDELNGRCNSIKVFRKPDDSVEDYEWDPTIYQSDSSDYSYSDHDFDDDKSDDGTRC